LADEDCITFDAETRIIRLSHSQITRLASRHYFMLLPTDEIGLSRVKQVFSEGFAIQITYRLAKDQPLSTPAEHEEANRVLTALRLVKPGNASYNIMFTEPSAFHPLGQVPGAGSTEPLIHNGVGETLHLLTPNLPISAGAMLSCACSLLLVRHSLRVLHSLDEGGCLYSCCTAAVVLLLCCLWVVVVLTFVRLPSAACPP